jgi:WD40 repeat protein
LQESGFNHSAYTFAHESMLLVGGLSISYPGGGSAQNLPHQQSHHQQRVSWHRSADKNLPPGALISFLQKGLQYVGIEESLLRQNDATGRDASTAGITADFSLLSPTSIQSLTRKNPPILLTVPPAAAAAVVRARLEAEQALNADTEFAVQRGRNIVQSSGSSRHLQGEPIQNENPQQSVNYQKERVNSLPSGGQQIVTDDFSNSGIKRSITGSKRSGKKQKTAHTAEANSHSSLEHDASSLDPHAMVMAHLEAVKQQQRFLDSYRDPSGSTSIDSSRRPDIAVENMPYLNSIPLYANSYSDRNGHQHDKNGEQEEMTRAPRLVDGSADKPSILRTSNTDIGDDDIQTDSNTAKDNSRVSTSSNGNAEDMLLAARPEEVLQLNEHQSEVFMCAWNPVYTNLIATGSGDASARIWEMNDMRANAGLKSSIELPHGIESGDRRKKDVTTLEWSADGLLLATGSYDGFARVWDRKGTLLHTLRGHNGPIFSLKWNRKGTFLLSGSYDKTIIVWNIAKDGGPDKENGSGTDYIEHQFKDHEAPALDVDWKDDTAFASCSSDRTVHIYNIDANAPLKIYKGHKDEVNAVKWSPSGKYLASCSDDCTAKVWEVDSDRTGPLYDFVSHDQEIYTIKWSPTGPGSSNTFKQLLLATASFDGSIRIWNMKDGSCYGYFNRHRDSVYSVAFSPSGDYLASGSLAGQMYIWDVSEGQCLKSYKGKGDIFEVAWNKEESRVAACFSSNVVSLIDFQRPIKPLYTVMKVEPTSSATSLLAVQTGTVAEEPRSS